MKSVHGGLTHRKVTPKTVKHFENSDNDRCLVGQYNQYLSYIPRKGGFYRKPLASTNEKFKYPRFSVALISQRLGGHDEKIL